MRGFAPLRLCGKTVGALPNGRATAPALARRGDNHIEDVAKDARHKRLTISGCRFAFAHGAGIVSRAKEFTQRAIAFIYLRNFERPLRIIGHLPTVGRIEQERNGSVWRSAIRVFLGKTHKFVRDAPERIQLKRMLARARLEKLIESLFEINRRDDGHVIQVIAFAIPRKRWARRRSVMRMEKVIRPGKVLRLRKRRRRVAKVWRV